MLLPVLKRNVTPLEKRKPASPIGASPTFLSSMNSILLALRVPVGSSWVVGGGGLYMNSVIISFGIAVRKVSLTSTLQIPPESSARAPTFTLLVMAIGFS